MRRLLKLGLVAWIGRWLALELASLLGRWRAPVQPRTDWTPGRMPRRREPDLGPDE